MGLQTFKSAIESYFSSPGKNLASLPEYAHALGAERDPQRCAEACHEPHEQCQLEGSREEPRQENGVSPQTVLQMHLPERLLARIAESPYLDTVALKGGVPIASMAAITQRTTMDMDATVVGMPMSESAARSMMEKACSWRSATGSSTRSTASRGSERRTCIPALERISL